MTFVKPYEAAVRLRWGVTEWTRFVLQQIQDMRPAETEAGREGVPLKLPCGLVVTISKAPAKPYPEYLGQSYPERYLVEKVALESIEDALEWDAKRRLGEPPKSEEFEIEIDGKLFRMFVPEDADAKSEDPP